MLDRFWGLVEEHLRGQVFCSVLEAIGPQEKESSKPISHSSSPVSVAG